MPADWLYRTPGYPRNWRHWVALKERMEGMLHPSDLPIAHMLLRDWLSSTIQVKRCLLWRSWNLAPGTVGRAEGELAHGNLGDSVNIHIWRDDPQITLFPLGTENTESQTNTPQIEGWRTPLSGNYLKRKNKIKTFW